MTPPAMAVAKNSEPLSDLPKREELEARRNTLDAALLEHRRKGAAQQTEWRTAEADLLRQWHATLKELSEL